MLIAVEEADLLAHASKGPELVDGIDLEKGRVKEECANNVQVLAGIYVVGVVNREGKDGMTDDPDVHMPVREPWDLFSLGKYWGFLVQRL